MKRKLLLFSLLVFVLIIGFVTYKLTAQNANNGILVMPSNFDLTITPGQSVEKTITIFNRTDSSITMNVDRRNFTAKGEEGGIEFVGDDTGNFALASWIAVTPERNVVIPAHSQKDFAFTVTAPKNAEPGGHFGSIVFGTVPGTFTGTGVGISQEVASLVLVRIPGDVREQARVESFAPDKNFYEFGPVNFTARIQNEGAVHVRPVGQILVTGIFGQKYAVNIDPENILPGAIRKIPAVMSNHFLFGKYNAQLILAYGSKNQNLYATTEFWAFPLRYIAVVIVGLVLLFLIRKRLWRALRAIVTGK